MKKFLAIALVLVLALSCFAACTGNGGGEEKQPEGKQTINVYAFTDEVPNMFTKYLEMHPEFAEKYDVNATIIATTDGLYQPALDQALAGGGADAPDIYCAEAAFVLKYTTGDASGYAATYNDLGIDVAAESAAAEIAPYTMEIGTRASDGQVVGMAYQATGGAFIYRSSYATEVFGDDSPATVEAAIGAGSGNWDKFFEAAEALKAKGYAIISGDGDMWHAVENSSTQPWVVDGKLVISPEREAFLDLSKKLKDNGYHHDTQDWTEAWYADMKADGKVFGFYGPAWLINYVMAGNSGGEAPGEGSYGDWRVCASNVGFCWGGTWLLANKDTTKTEAVAELIRFVTLDATENGLQTAWANGSFTGTKDACSSNVVMSKADGSLDFLGGQNMFPAFMEGNKYANGSILTQYDEQINGKWRDQVRQYTSGAKDKETAIADFKQAVADELGIQAA